jgi:ubiquinone/menaquinone biosynthesis C-methylase UbiE
VRLDRTSARAYAGVAEEYERCRPSYPPEIVAWVVERLGLEPRRTVVDIGAGTGKFTRLLVPSGARVIAVEPLAEMRAQLSAAVTGVEVLAGSAEQLPLEDAPIDAATAAAAFHWFELDRALPELHRVLRPGGRLAIVHNFRDPGQPLQAAVQEIIGHLLPDASEFEQWESAVEESGLFGPLASFQVTHEQHFDAEGLAERVSTISYVARLPDEERAAVLAAVRALGEAQPETPFPFRYQSEAFVCERRSDH